MALHALNPEQLQPIVNGLLAFLDREDITVPGNLVETIVSGKSLLRAIAQDQIILAQDVSEEAPNSDPVPDLEADLDVDSEKAA